MKNNFNSFKTIIIFGGTSDIVNACIHRWCKSENFKFILIGREINRLEAIKSNLSTRYPESIFEIITLDFNDISSIITIIKKIFLQEKVFIALVAHGNLSVQKNCQENLEVCRNELIVNGLSACLISEELSNALYFQGGGVLAVIGSVAGDRGRKSNYTYGAAKSMVNTYIQGLQHRFYNSLVNVILIKPGPTRTSMTSHLAASGTNLADLSLVAKIIIKGISKKKKTIYAPKKWTLIMWIIRMLPSFIFNRLDI